MMEKNENELYTDPGSWQQKKSDPDFVSVHSFNFGGLQENTVYFFVIEHCTGMMCNRTTEYFFRTTSCNDGIVNGGEYDIDCGGPCDNPCSEILLDCSWCRSDIIPVHLQGLPEEKIDVVFIASKTSWNHVTREKVRSFTYTSNRDAFVSDVKELIHKWYLKLDTLVSEPIPGDFKERFNFYYYWDSDNFGDAFVGCNGELPENFWSVAPFADVAGILYPPFYVDGSTSAAGCSGVGPRSHFKAPGFHGYVTIHESGHAIFGLMDEYCGETAYGQNDPYPNAWSSESNCRDDVSDEDWNPDDCRQIMWDDPDTPEADCSKDYWRWNPDPEIMECACGTFGPVCVRRINYVLEHIDEWRE